MVELLLKLNRLSNDFNISAREKQLPALMDKNHLPARGNVTEDPPHHFPRRIDDFDLMSGQTVVFPPQLKHLLWILLTYNIIPVYYFCQSFNQIFDIKMLFCQRKQ